MKCDEHPQAAISHPSSWLARPLTSTDCRHSRSVRSRCLNALRRRTGQGHGACLAGVSPTSRGAWSRPPSAARLRDGEAGNRLGECFPCVSAPMEEARDDVLAYMSFRESTGARFAWRSHASRSSASSAPYQSREHLPHKSGKRLELLEGSLPQAISVWLSNNGRLLGIDKSTGLSARQKFLRRMAESLRREGALRRAAGADSFGATIVIQSSRRQASGVEPKSSQLFGRNELDPPNAPQDRQLRRLRKRDKIDR